jgi:hypothetical protein
MSYAKAKESSPMEGGADGGKCFALSTYLAPFKTTTACI